MTNKDLLYSIGNYIQYSVMAYTRKESKKSGYMYVCVYIYIYIYIGEDNGNPLQYSCLENPTDRGA